MSRPDKTRSATWAVGGDGGIRGDSCPCELTDFDVSFASGTAFHSIVLVTVVCGQCGAEVVNRAFQPWDERSDGGLRGAK